MNNPTAGRIHRYENILQRATLLAMLRAALESGETRFARQAALNWLAAYPGDLEVTLLQAQVFLADGRPNQALPALELACQIDPFSIDAYRLLVDACRTMDPAHCSHAQTALYVLGSQASPAGQLEPWGEPLRQAVEALELKNDGEAERRVQEAVRRAPDLLLPAAVHLLVDRAAEETLAVYHLAKMYSERWPDCLLFHLVLAETQLELGNEPEAVRLLHLCVSRDAAGQTARRLWGENNPYQALWPEGMAIPFDLPVPAGVASRLGWNRLTPGSSGPAEPSQVAEPAPARQEEASEPARKQRPVYTPHTPAVVETDPIPLPPPVYESKAVPEPDSEPAVLLSETKPAEAAAESGSEPPVLGSTPSADLAEEIDLESDPELVTVTEGLEDLVSSAEIAFDRLARKTRQSPASRNDGRFPLYVIFSSKEGLNRQYGPRTTEVLDGEMRRLAGLVRQRKGWGALVYYPDDAACASQCGLLPMDSSDPWKLKHALSELDEALGKRGERIGALLIVGGDTIVPFHRLPNPTDDSDGEVPSDSPYATLDSNYFIPEWPVGRLPGEAGPDAGLLLEQIRELQRYHSKKGRRGGLFGLNLLRVFRRLVDSVIPSKPAPSFGYTAAVWRRSSLAVFRPIGAPHTVLASPPQQSGSFDRGRITAASLGYYNLHGLEDSPSWYGQRDPQEPGGPDYPVALAPEDLHRNGHAPRVVFSEACYGGHVLGKCEKDSLALKFLSMGTLGVVASTCTAYGSVNTPLVAADLLGNRFWQHLKDGRPAGEALLRAKIDMVREMEKRQGFLDGEDQKTLISFVLYGDPLAAYEGFRIQSKAAPRSKDHPAVKTVTDLPEQGQASHTVPPEVFKQVKGLLAEYLPGADLAELHFARQHPDDGASGASPHAPGVQRKDAPNARPYGSGRLVVTASKQVQVAQHVHRHYVRMTLDEAGKPVKLSISR